MSDFAAAGHKPADFSDRIRREIVVQDKVFASVSVDIVVGLFVERRTERRHRERLRFAARKECRTVRARQHVDFARDRTDFVALASVYAHAFVEDRFAQQLILNVVHERAEELFLHFVRKLFGVFFGDFIFDRFDCGAPLHFAVTETRFFHERRRFGFDRFRICKRHRKRRERELFFAAQFLQLFLQSAHFRDKALRFFERTEHHVFRRFVRAAFDHRKALGGTRNDDFQIGLFDLRKRRIDDVFAVQICDAAGGNGSVKRNVRNRHRSARRDNRNDILRVNAVGGNAGRHDLNFASERHFEQRPHRPVDKARDEDLFILRPPFPLYKAAGNLSRSVKFFVVIDGDRNIIHTLDRIVRCAHRRNDRRSAPLSEYAAVCLFAYPSRLQNQVGVSDSRSYSLYHLVLLNSLSFFSEINNQ